MQTQKQANAFFKQFGTDSLAPLVAAMVGRNATDLQEMLDTVASRNFDYAKVPMPSTKVWLGFYSRPLSLLAAFLRPFGVSAQDTRQIAKGFKALVKFEQCYTPAERQAKAAAWVASREGKAFLAKHDAEIRGLISNVLTSTFGPLDNGLPPSPEQAVFFEKLAKSGVLTFVATVMIPCIMETGEYPWVIFQRAVKGNLDAVCTLLRFDVTILADEAIGKYAQVSLRADRLRQSTLARAVDGVPMMFTRKAVKERLGGLMALLQPGDLSFNASTIRSVFDFLEQQKTGNPYAHDPEISTGETFSKSIQRNRKKWKIGPAPRPDTV